MVYDTYYIKLYYSIHGVYKPTYNWGAPHCGMVGWDDFLATPATERRLPQVSWLYPRRQSRNGRDTKGLGGRDAGWRIMEFGRAIKHTPKKTWSI